MSNELDLQDHTRMMDTYKDINDIIDRISNLQLFPPLVWVYAWDVAKDLYRDFQEGSEGEYVVTMSIEKFWELFYNNADQNGFSLDYGSDDMYEQIRDWMFDAGVVEDVEFDEDEDDVLESDGGNNG